MADIEVTVLDRCQAVNADISLTLVKVVRFLDQLFFLNVDGNVEFLQLLVLELLVIKTLDSDC